MGNANKSFKKLSNIETSRKLKAQFHEFQSTFEGSKTLSIDYETYRKNVVKIKTVMQTIGKASSEKKWTILTLFGKSAWSGQ